VNVLVVDDDAAVCQAIRRSLAEHHDVLALTSAEEALARIVAGERFDVIFSDVMMPSVTGMELYERIRGVAPDQAPRVVFLTGGAFTTEARVFLDSVANETIEKPFEPAKLLAVIARLSG
jgi:CheY-like chemotaxis protein